MSPPAVAALVAAAALAAALGVRRGARRDRARRLWWAAAVLAGVAALPASGAVVPVGAALAGGGLVAAAVVDAVEGRIPTPVAHAATGVSALALAGHAVLVGEWPVALRAALLTGGLVAALALLWLLGGVGFGDVRLAGGTATAMAGGVGALLVLVYVALAVGVVTVVGRRAAGRRGGVIPFGPALAAGWVAALIWT